MTAILQSFFATEFIMEAAQFVAQPEHLLIIAGVSVIGVILGATPGVGPALAMAIAFPFTFTMQPAEALLIMAVLYGSTTYGGSISAILINVPGTPGSAATLIDGYPMTQRGESATALGISTAGSFFGAIIGLIGLMIFAPLLAQLIFLLGAPEFFLLAVFGMSIVSAVTRGSLLKSLAAMSLGVLAAVIGPDPIRAFSRYSFDVTYLEGGMNLIVVLIGLFAVSQTLTLGIELWNRKAEGRGISPAAYTGSVVEGLLVPLRHPFQSLRGSIIGVTVGSIPGIGLSGANFLSYLTAVTSSKRPELFGTGHDEGVLAAETANNGSAMGALIPAMAFGIPGGAAAAVFIGVMITFGITPGPGVFEGALPFIIFISILIGDLVFLIAGVFGARHIAKVTTLPRDVLLTGILIFALVGAFSMRSNILDVGAAIFFGLVGFGFDRYGYDKIAFILGFILTPIAEAGFQRAMILSDGSYMIFVTRPISLALLIATVVMLLFPIVLRVIRTDITMEAA